MSASAATVTEAFTDNVEFVGYDDLDGRSGFKLALHEANGRFYLYVAALWHPGWSIVDVTDPRHAALRALDPRPAEHVDDPGAGRRRADGHEPRAHAAGWGGQLRRRRRRRGS